MFLKWGKGILLPVFFKGSFLLASPVSCWDGVKDNKESNHSQKRIGQHFAGEELKYTLSFLWFKKAATCEVDFQPLPQKGNFLATVKGQTHGFIGMATRFRRDILTSLMEEVDGGKRLRPLEFREDVVIGHRHRKKVTCFDYSKHQVMITKERKNGVKQKTIPIPNGETFYDPITGYYNFRFGYFGPIKRGRRYLIKTVPRKEFTCMRITIASPEEERKRRSNPASGDEKAYLVFLEINKDIIRSKSGKVEGWLSSRLVPTEGRVKDVIFFGDVVGRLVGQGKNIEEAKFAVFCRSSS